MEFGSDVWLRGAGDGNQEDVDEISQDDRGNTDTSDSRSFGEIDGCIHSEDGKPYRGGNSAATVDASDVIDSGRVFSNSER